MNWCRSSSDKYILLPPSYLIAVFGPWQMRKDQSVFVAHVFCCVRLPLLAQALCYFHGFSYLGFVKPSCYTGRPFLNFLPNEWCVFKCVFLTPPSWIFERLENVEVPPSEKDEKAGLFYTGGESLMRFDEFWRVDLVLIVVIPCNPWHMTRYNEIRGIILQA